MSDACAVLALAAFGLFVLVLAVLGALRLPGAEMAPDAGGAGAAKMATEAVLRADGVHTVFGVANEVPAEAATDLPPPLHPHGGSAAVMVVISVGHCSVVCLTHVQCVASSS